MDLDADGLIDILSGSYSRMEGEMAGLFQVLRGQEGGGFAPAAVLAGTDGAPLVVPAPGEEGTIDRICTRPTAVDLDADGKLDIVTGNFRGTFYLFRGEGGGRFAPGATQLRAGGEPLAVKAHGDPFFVDWDRDGDLDLLSGSAQGGVVLATNEGTSRAASFRAPVELVPPAGERQRVVTVDDGHLRGPQGSTRVWADDVDGDGLLDLLVGDSVTLYLPLEGAEVAATQARYDEWLAREAKLLEEYDEQNVSEEWDREWNALREELETIVRTEMTGTVWLFRQVRPPAGNAPR